MTPGTLAVVRGTPGAYELELVDRAMTQEIILAVEAREQWADVTGLEPCARLCRLALRRLRPCVCETDPLPRKEK